MQQGVVLPEHYPQHYPQPTIKNSHSTKVQLGLALKELGFEGREHGHQVYYRVIPLKAA